MSENTQPSRSTMARRKNAREHRTRLVGEGGRRLEILLQPEAAKALERLMEERKASATSVIGSLLLLAPSRKE